MKISIESDGTVSGTKLTVDGARVNNLDSIYLSLYASYQDNISFNYGIKKKTSGDMNVRTSYEYDPSKGSLQEKPHDGEGDYQRM